MKRFLSILLTFSLLQAQSFFTLTGVKQYRILVANTSSKVDKRYNKEIEAMLMEMSKEIGIDMKKDTGTVLVLVLRTILVDQCIGIRIDLELGEYLPRPGSSENVLAITYIDTRRISVDAVEDDLTDTVEEMAEKFALQYKDDNKVLMKVQEDKKNSEKKVLHENFAQEMGYETNYRVAMEKAKKAGKPVMAFITTTYCPWCRKMESRILSKARIDAQIKKKYIPLLLNFDEKAFPKALHKITVTPTVYIIDSKTEKILHTFVGYSSREDILRELK
ncbi:thioredoxin fold domain-containing protein [Sulfurovum sp. NBC37-1]|uniref:thioredoxin fold domain-containing protein n=1 Tax=Sulfurovum sp. (strain NBC37-1) TaxID=387093 RepID=UPI0001587CBB|nr:thioredoxin fold domain-containing protein [Sulfurovum sp. NBC37-1]BAF72281.1 hypothetical protein SUN_1328 [Sulfurovum sp. NBC37-1]